MNKFQESLKRKMDDYAHFIYKLTGKFPKHEIYGCTSQLRRASLSVILNYIEGFARMKKAVKINFWEIAYGSLAEPRYLVEFCSKEGYVSPTDRDIAAGMAEEVGAMLYHLLKTE